MLVIPFTENFVTKCIPYQFLLLVILLKGNFLLGISTFVHKNSKRSLENLKKYIIMHGTIKWMKWTNMRHLEHPQTVVVVVAEYICYALSFDSSDFTISTSPVSKFRKSATSTGCVHREFGVRLVGFAEQLKRC